MHGSAAAWHAACVRKRVLLWCQGPSDLASKVAAGFQPSSTALHAVQHPGHASCTTASCSHGCHAAGAHTRSTASTSSGIAI